MAHSSQTLSRDDDDPGARGEAAGVPLLYVLLECDRPLAGSSRHRLDGIDRVELGRADGRSATRQGSVLTIGVPDGRMSQRHARLVRRGDGWVAEDAGSKNGLLVAGERRDRAALVDGAVLELGHTLFLYREVAPPDGPPDLDAAALPEHGGLRTLVPELSRALADLAAVAATQSSILVLGETGTGKELTARAVHQLAGRSGEFVAVNCGALPDALVESELYGHRRGAFSGAEQDRPGLVRSADRGTLFLDEIADLPLASQAALLRVLQEREVTPVGATQPIPVDLEVVAATHHDLAERVERGAFRRDLYARLAGFTVRLPPLRERREDLGLLLAALLPRVARGDEPAPRLSCAAARALLEHDWPLNVRELESCLRVAAALARGGPIRLEHLPEAVRAPGGGAAPGRGAGRADDAAGGPLSPADQALRDELCALLGEHRGNVSAVARATGKARVQIRRWLRRYGLDPEQFR